MGRGTSSKMERERKVRGSGLPSGPGEGIGWYDQAEGGVRAERSGLLANRCSGVNTHTSKRALEGARVSINGRRVPPLMTLSKETCQSLSALKCAQTHGPHRELTCSVFTFVSETKDHDQFVLCFNLQVLHPSPT